jgi:hypothetical protein
MGVYMIDLKRAICKLIVKRDFTASGIMESLSEFGQKSFQSSSKYLWWSIFGRFLLEDCRAHQNIFSGQCQVGFIRILQNSSKYILWTMSGRFYKEFAELIKISRVDNVRSVLKGVCRAHQNILCEQCQVGFIRVQIQKELISDLKREN